VFKQRVLAKVSMRIKFLLLLITVLFSSICCGQGNSTLILDGNYQGKNLYVQNPFAGSGAGFCIFEVKINDRVTTDETNSSAFEIDFPGAQIQLGEKVEVKVFHKSDCKPKFLNPDVLKPKSTFETVSISVDKDGVLRWGTKGESGKLAFAVEHYRWNKWVNVGEVEGTGTSGLNEYSFKIAPHSGENQFRVKQVDYTGKSRSSTTAKYKSLSPEVSFSPLKASKEIIFSDETMYEIYDIYGNIVKKGFAKKVDVSNLIKNIYYLNFDNKMDQFIKK
jgi:hypothetical protein